MLSRCGICVRSRAAPLAIPGLAAASSTRWKPPSPASRGVSDNAYGPKAKRRPKDGEGAGSENTRVPPEETRQKVRDDVQRLVKSRQTDEHRADWRELPGHHVSHRFRIEDPPAKGSGSVMGGRKRSGGQRSTHEMDASTMDSIASNLTNEREERKRPPAGEAPPSVKLPYSDYSGLRFPTLETAENFDYHKDRGLDRIRERSYPIKVPKHRRLDPYLREYIHFLHRIDPARFTVARIAERYRMRAKTVSKVVSEWGTNQYLTRSGLTRLGEKLQTKESVILAKKEQQYGKWVGWDQLGDEDDPQTDDEALGEFRGWRSTNDWVRRQNVEVEMMSAFPMMEKRDPMPKRVDVDLVVDSQRYHKVINWIDPTDKVVF